MTEHTAEIRSEGSINPLTMRDFVYVLFRHKWKMLFFFAVVVCSVIVYTAVSPKIYQSEAKLLLKVGRESVTLDPTAATGQVMHITQTRLSEINSEIEILRGRDLIEEVVDAIGTERLLSTSKAPGAAGQAQWVDGIKSLMRWPKKKLKELLATETLSDEEKVLLSIYDNLYVGAEKDSNIIKISYTAKSPDLAQRVVSELIKLSLVRHIAAHRTAGSYEFFVDQTEQLKQKLEASQNRLKALKNKMGIASIERQQLILLERIQSLEAEKDTTESSLASSTAKVGSLEEAMVQIPETMVLEETTGYPNPGVDAMREELFKLQIEEEKLLKTFSEDSRSVESIREEIARAEELLKEEKGRSQVKKGLNRSHQELKLSLLTEKAERVALKERLNSLSQQIKAVRQQLAPLNEAEMEISSLTRDISTQEMNLLKYSDNLEQARIDDAMENQRISNISIVQEATFPIKSIRPRTLLNLGFGFFLGVLGALLLGVISELMDHTIKSPVDIETKLGLRNLGYIPKLRSGQLNGYTPAKVSVGSRISRKADSGTPLDRFSATSQRHYLGLKERLFQSLNGSAAGGYVIGVTSYHRREGVSTIAANLAKVIGSRQVGKVLLIDANISNPAVHKMMGVGLSPGLTDVLRTCSAKDSFRQVHHVSVLPAGQGDESLSEELTWKRFKNLLSQCKKRYAFTIIDIPSLGQSVDGFKVVSACDGIVMAIESEQLRLEVAQEWCKQFAAGGVKTIGAVLNKRRFYIPKWIYNTL